jgi:hypothetical protein
MQVAIACAKNLSLSVDRSRYHRIVVRIGGHNLRRGRGCGTHYKGSGLERLHVGIKLGVVEFVEQSHPRIAKGTGNFRKNER